MKLCGNKNQTADANVPLSGMVEPNLMGVTLRARSYLQMKANTSTFEYVTKKKREQIVVHCEHSLARLVKTSILYQTGPLFVLWPPRAKCTP